MKTRGSIYFTVNRGYYEENELPQQNWRWPKGTWFQGRLGYVREHQPLRKLTSQRKFHHDGTTNDVVMASSTPGNM